MNETVIEILQTVGVYDSLMGKVKDENELVEMFLNHFETLVSKCQE